MKDLWKAWTAVGVGLLAYSGFLAPWVGERAAPQLVGDLWAALQRGGDAALVGRLLAAFLALYGGMAVIGLLGWLCFYRHRPAAGVWALAASAGGVVVAGYLAARGAEWGGTFAAVAGFLLVGTGCYALSREMGVSWPRGRALALARWAGRARAARAEGAPVTVAVCRDVLPLKPEVRHRLVDGLRAGDDAVFFADGAVFWLGATPCERAREAVRRLQRQFPASGAAFCGLACAEGEAVDVAALIEQAAAAQAFAATVGIPVQGAAEAVLPAPLQATLSAIPADPALLEAAVRAWEALPAPRQALVVHFSPPELAAALEEEARRVLRGADRVLPLTPHRLLVFLPRTGAAGAARVQVRLREQLAALAGVAEGTVVVYRLEAERLAGGEALVQAALQAPGEGLLREIIS